jgi:hypothetical protein
MKKFSIALSIIFFRFSLIALSGLIFIGCNSNADESPPEKEVPVVKDFVLTYSASWNYNSIPWNTTVLNADTVFIINTQEQFAKYFPTATSKPDNFTDYSLLFAYGKTTGKIVKTSYDLVPETDGTYRLDIDIELAAEQTPDVWYVSVLVPKIPDVSIIPYKKAYSGIITEENPDNGGDDNNPPEINHEYQVPYAACNHEGKYLSTTDVEGNAYLFNNNVPEAIKAELQKEKESSGFVAWIVYVSDDNTATMYVSSKNEESTGKICNYPEFAKLWEIPLNGQKISYTGTAFKVGEYLSIPPHVGYDLVLNTLKINK